MRILLLVLLALPALVYFCAVLESGAAFLMDTALRPDRDGHYARSQRLTQWAVALFLTATLAAIIILNWDGTARWFRDTFR